MMHSVLGRTLYERRWFIVGWSVAVMGMVWLVILFYHAFSDTSGIEEVFKKAPDSFKAFLGDPEANKSISGYIGQQVYDLRVALLVMIMGLNFATSLTLREEEDSGLRTLSVIPQSRRRILLSKWLSGLVATGIVSLASVVGAYAGILSIQEPIPHSVLWQIFLLTWLFAVSVFSIPFAVGISTGHRGVTMAIGLSVTIGSFILATFAKAVEWLKDWQWLSLMNYYNTPELVKNGVVVGDVVTLAGIALVAVIAALVIFPKRDIA